VALPDPGHRLVLLALDCEMCASTASDKELLQVAVVDQDGRQVMKVGRCDTSCRAVCAQAGALSHASVMSLVLAALFLQGGGN
jgi:hypothetical protein